LLGEQPIYSSLLRVDVVGREAPCKSAE